MTDQTPFNQVECEALMRRTLGMLTTTPAQVEIAGSRMASTQFARGEMQAASETTQTQITVSVEVNGRHATAMTNQLDEDGLRAIVREGETAARNDPTPEEWIPRSPQTYPEAPPIYFDATATAMAPDVQAALADQAITAAERGRLIAAGDIATSTYARAVCNTEGMFAYECRSFGEISMTVRGQTNNASGWAWSGFEDWRRVDPAAVMARAVDLAQRSANPVAIEPGRYTVILEPVALAALLTPLLRYPISSGGFSGWRAADADLQRTVFGKNPFGTNKIGLQMIDQRLGMVSDPWDPDHPKSTIGSTWGGEWLPVKSVVWFEHGILKNLEYDPDYARATGRATVLDPGGLRVTAEGASTSLDDMIASTKRGIWVNRFSNVAMVNNRTLLLTGTTRDGTFLIENGKITKPIKNFRFTESPFFVLNKLEAFGTPTRASQLVVAPRVMVRDFDFTSLTDAI